MSGRCRSESTPGVNSSRVRLRHTAATLWLTNGVHFIQVAKWLGHSSYVLTLTACADYISEKRQRTARNRPGARPDQLGPGGRTRDGWRLLLLAQANAFTRVGTGAGDTLDLRHAALRRGWHTHSSHGRVLHLTHGALCYRGRRAGRWYGEDGDRRGSRNCDRESTGKD